MCACSDPLPGSPLAYASHQPAQNAIASRVAKSTSADFPDPGFWGSLRDFTCPVARLSGTWTIYLQIRLPTVNARLPKELIQILVSPDALGVASGRESRVRYNSMDVIARLAYQDRQVECRLACANQGHCSGAIRVHCIGTCAGTPDQRNVAVYRDCGHLRQLAAAVERRFGNAIHEERPPGRQNLTVNRKCVGSLNGRICKPAGVCSYR